MILYYLKTILKLLLIYNFIFKIILALFLLYTVKLLHQCKKNYKVTIDTFKVDYLYLFALITALFFTRYVILFTYLQYVNLSKFLDLKSLIYSLYLVLKFNSFFTNIMIIINMIIIIYYIISLTSKYLFIHFLKLHIFITYMTCNGPVYQDNFYDTLQNHLLFNYDNIFSNFFINKPLKILYKLLKKYKPTAININIDNDCDFRLYIKLLSMKNGFQNTYYYFTFYIISDIIIWF